jgi:hypothetical protein
MIQEIFEWIGEVVVYGILESIAESKWKWIFFVVMLVVVLVILVLVWR